MKVLLISLGCDKNLVDSEHMLSLLAKDGFVLTQEETEAEAAIVNTCCFISDAMEESIQTLIDIGRLKETANLRYLIVAGCLAGSGRRGRHQRFRQYRGDPASA